MSELQRSVKVESASDERMILSVGPHHPSTHGVLRVVLELEGETIITAHPEHGFLHTGIEKSAETLTWNQAVTVIDRMDYLSPLSNNLGYILAAEKLLGVEATPRTQYVRTILTELQRIASHLVWLGTGALDMGASSPFFYAFDMREGILDILEETTGARLNPSYFRVGGLAYDVPDNFYRLVDEWLKRFPSRMQELRDILDANPIWVDRLKGVGVISAEDAIAYGLTGPNLRASGVNYDVRKVNPYLIYDKLSFKVPVYTNGDSFDRYRVRMDELEESYKLCRQALDSLPAGPFQIDDRKLVLPPKEEVKTSMESLIHHFKLVSYGFDVPAGEVYQAVESPRGEIGFYIVSDGGNKPMRVRVRPPSFYTIHALGKMMAGDMIADMVATIASADPVFGEVDR